MDCGFYLVSINSKKSIFIMDIMNTPAGEVASFYNFNSRLDVLIYGSWSVRDFGA